MRMLAVAAGAAFLILAAGPALASGPTGGGQHGGCGSCGGGHPGGGHPGGGSVNVNVNANASAHASAQSFASARSSLNAHTYNVGGARGAVGGGTVYVASGGYGGDAVWYGGPVYYNEAPYEGRSCGAAPFGYVLTGFGRRERTAPVCAPVETVRASETHAYSESSYEESRSESYEYRSVEARTESGAFIDRSDHRDERYERPSGVSDFDRGYMQGRRDCDCRADGRDGEPYLAASEPAPYVVAPEPAPYVPGPEATPYVPAPAPGATPYAPAPGYQAPMTPNQYYGIGGATPPAPTERPWSQEPGERG